MERDITQKLDREIARIPEAKPSRPSVILTALAKATITKVENKT